MPPTVAAYAIAYYSRTGAIVVDPDCGAGVVVTEAVHAGRHAVGMTSDSRFWAVARANITAAKRAGAWADAAVVDLSPTRTRPLREAGLVRRADLVLTTVRAGTFAGGRGPDSDLESWIRGRVRMWTALLRPGGYTVIVLRPYRSADGALLDVPTAVFDAAMAAGLVPVDRCVALTPIVRGRGSVAEFGAGVAGSPIAVVAHHTVLVLQAPDLIENSQQIAPATWSMARPHMPGDLASGDGVQGFEERHGVTA